MGTLTFGDEAFLAHALGEERARSEASLRVRRRSVVLAGRKAR